MKLFTTTATTVLVYCCASAVLLCSLQVVAPASKFENAELQAQRSYGAQQCTNDQGQVAADCTQQQQLGNLKQGPATPKYTKESKGITFITKLQQRAADQVQCQPLQVYPYPQQGSPKRRQMHNPQRPYRLIMAQQQQQNILQQLNVSQQQLQPCNLQANIFDCQRLHTTKVSKLHSDQDYNSVYAHVYTANAAAIGNTQMQHQPMSIGVGNNRLTNYNNDNDNAVAHGLPQQTKEAENAQAAAVAKKELKRQQNRASAKKYRQRLKAAAEQGNEEAKEKVALHAKQSTERCRAWCQTLKAAVDGGDQEAIDRHELRKQRNRASYKKFRQRRKAAADQGDEDAKEKIALRAKQNTERNKEWRQRLKAAAEEGDKEAIGKLNVLRQQTNARNKRLRQRLKEAASEGSQEAIDKQKLSNASYERCSDRLVAAANGGDEKAITKIKRIKQSNRESHMECRERKKEEKEEKEMEKTRSSLPQQTKEELRIIRDAESQISEEENKQTAQTAGVMDAVNQGASTLPQCNARYNRGSAHVTAEAIVPAAQACVDSPKRLRQNVLNIQNDAPPCTRSQGLCSYILPSQPIWQGTHGSTQGQQLTNNNDWQQHIDYSKVPLSKYSPHAQRGACTPSLPIVQETDGNTQGQPLDEEELLECVMDWLEEQGHDLDIDTQQGMSRPPSAPSISVPQQQGQTAKYFPRPQHMNFENMPLPKSSGGEISKSNVLSPKEPDAWSNEMLQQLQEGQLTSYSNTPGGSRYPITKTGGGI